MLNGTIATFVGFYLLTVLYADNEDKLLAAIKQETGFLKWGGALIMLYYLYKFAGGKAGELIQQLTLLALVALLLSRGGEPLKQVGQFFSESESGKNDKPTSAKDYYDKFLNMAR